jgi:hypothetical protein
MQHASYQSFNTGSTVVLADQKVSHTCAFSFQDEILLVESFKKHSTRLQKKMTKRCAQLCETNLPKLFGRGGKGMLKTILNPHC